MSATRFQRPTNVAYYARNREREIGRVRLRQASTVAFLRELGTGHAWMMARILDEAAKCDIVCANCHRVRTYDRRMAGRGAGVAQLVERQPSKLDVAGSNPVSRSKSSR